MCHNTAVRDEREYVVRPIGVVRSPFHAKVEAPRQPRAAEGVEGRLELDPSLLHAVEDLEGFEHVWVIAWLDRVEGFRPKVHPPRSEIKRGVLATRAPHRPNPLALSVMELVRVEGTVLHVRGVDLLDGTPVLDVKPYVPWTDAIPRSRVGWLDEDAPRLDEDRPPDPRGAFVVEILPRATEQLAWLAEHGVLLEPVVRGVLETSPHPRPYRRIKRDREGGFVLAIGEWRIAFRLDAEERVHVTELRSGYRARERGDHPRHARFVERFG